MVFRKAFILLLITLTITGKAISQVNLQTGGIAYSIPLYSYQDAANRLSTGLSLVYTATNGLKVNDYSSEFGAGWALNFGGVVERIQNGEPDDQKQDAVYDYPNIVNIFTWNSYLGTYYPNGYMYSEYDPSIPIDNAGGYTPLFENESKYKKNPIYLADREQDVFAFSFNGRSGTFLIGKTGTIRTTIDSRLKIDKVITNMSADNIRTRISEFWITDENGIKYVFKDRELSEVIEYNRVHGSLTYDWGHIPPVVPINTVYPRTADYYSGTPTNQFIVNKWFLSEIINPNTQQKILFIYDTYNIDFLAEKIGNHTSINQGNSSGYDETTQTGFIQMRKKGALKRIKQVKLTEKEQVEFVYSVSNRKDIPSCKAIEEIQIKYENNIVNKWKFELGYFVGNAIKGFNDAFTQEEMYKSRLCLLKLCNTGKNLSCTTPPYQFDYFVGTIPTPAGNTIENIDYPVSPMFSFYQDHWGYSSIPPSYRDEYLEQPRNDINFGNINWHHVHRYATNSILSSPNLKFRDPWPWEPGLYAPTYINGTLRSVKFPYGGSLTYDFEPNKAIKIGTTQEYRTGGGRVSKTTIYDGNNHTNDIVKEYKYTLASGASSGWGYEEPVYRNDVTSRVWKCSNKKPGIGTFQIASAFHTSLSSIMEINYLNSFSFARSGNTMSRATWIDTKNAAEARMSAAAQQMVASLLIHILIDIFSPAYKDFPIEQYSTISNTSSNPLPTLYSRVEVIDKLATSTVGKSVLEFTSNQDYPIDVPVIAVPNSKKPRYAPWLYGLPKASYTYNAAGNILKKTEAFYQPVKNTLSDNNFLSCKWEPVFLTSNCSLTPLITSSPANCINQESYFPFYGRIQTGSTKEYFYNANGESTFTTTEFEYNSLNFQVYKVKTTNSKGEQIENVTSYPESYYMPGSAVQALTDNNIVNIPIGNQTIIKKTDNQDYVIGGTVTEFGVQLNGDIKPIKTYSLRNNIPVPAASVPFSFTQIIPNSTYYFETGSINYNSAGLPAQVNSETRKAGTLYDYDNKLPVATIANADVGDIAYTSFEAEGTGNWSFNFQHVSDESFVTGRKCFKFSSTGGSISKTVLNINQVYKLSFWSKGGLPNIYKGIPLNHSAAGISLIKSYTNTVSGWTYYEYSISNTGSFMIDNNLGGLIESPPVFYLDEIRLYPLNAVISTVTYDPLIGKTSETDDNGRIMYYEYDDLGRLKLVLDEKRNVLKSYEYNYKQ